MKQKLEQIRIKLGEDALPLVKKRSVKSRWRMLAKITALHRGFVPNYPESLAINPRMFIEIFPYHVIFDTEMKVVQSGIRIQMLVPSIRSRHANLDDFFVLRYPNCVDLNYDNIERFVLCPFILELRRDNMAKDWQEKPALQLKGNFGVVKSECFFFKF